MAECPTNWKLYNNQCIGLIRLHYTFDDARKYCQVTMDADLVVIDSQEKENFIESYVASRDTTANWIGLKDIKGDDAKSSHVWLPTGKSVIETGYDNWHSLEPNYRSHLCVILYMDRIPEWRDRHCSYNYYFICERGNTYIPNQLLAFDSYFCF